MIGHYVPVPAETGWTDGDLEDKYVTSRYRVLMNKDEYDRIMAYIRELQGRSHMWSAELYNCNAFVADMAKEMGLAGAVVDADLSKDLRQSPAPDEHRPSRTRTTRWSATTSRK